MKKLALAALLALSITGMAFLNAPLVSAQTATPVPTTTGPSNSVEGFLVVCPDSAVLNFSGTMLVGFDIYYQIFSGSAGSGTAITNVRQVPAAGDFAVSDVVNFNSGVTVAAGGTASANVSVARESNSSRVDFSFVLTDTQDGCNNPTNTLVTSTDTGAGSSATTSNSGAGVTTSLLAPDGVLNPNLSAEPDIVIGARLSDHFRSDTPGLIFAECDAYALAEPGIIYDTDSVTIYWSWFAKTQADLQQHLDNALYHVTLNTAELPMTTRSEPVLAQRRLLGLLHRPRRQLATGALRGRLSASVGEPDHRRLQRFRTRYVGHARERHLQLRRDPQPGRDDHRALRHVFPDHLSCARHHARLLTNGARSFEPLTPTPLPRKRREGEEREFCPSPRLRGRGTACVSKQGEGQEAQADQYRWLLIMPHSLRRRRRCSTWR